MPDETFYYRPLVQTGPTRPDGALELAGGWTWFTHVERLARDQAAQIMPAKDIPPHALSRLTQPRAQIAGLDMGQVSLMGILNVTPDSFSDGGKFIAPQAAIDHALTMCEAGADMIDIGGESTRPGAAYVDPLDEINRTAPIIRAIRDVSAVPMSIDTRKADVADHAVQAGATLINDVYAFTHDPDLAKVAAQSRVPVCLMHAQGDPEVMQDNPAYKNVLLDVYDFLDARIKLAEAAGIPRDQIMVDPGIGFGKTVAHNLEILSRISLFHSLGCAILLGASRKRFIGAIGQEPDAIQRLGGSIAVALQGVAQGVQVLRVHDIKQTKQALALWLAASSGEYNDVP
ncbi:dihydropteroate synthase [Pacificibacter maritimus]|uniref:Dihydropteroate synthase n=1 Tax=Pacificibacter maritimus TaxID=762213 RepID=A0A3N4UKE4_9RHOB|nr:dihydropteroate synthase [Pacificibacter maritimus]RPE71062.1 dihydropteroate synthase [Pacificibacter maritimus]